MLALNVSETKAVSFANDRLKELAGYAGLQGLDALRPGVCNTYTYKQHPLTIRVNKWNEVEHIGLLLFPQQLRSINPMPLYDFLERYLLALQVTPKDSEYGTKISWDNVHFATGNALTSLQIDTTAEFSENHVDLHVYKVAWSKGGKKLLEISFPMDWQLLSGCNTIELEQNIFRNLRRYAAGKCPQTSREYPKDQTAYTQSGNYFVSPMVRNDLYFSRPDTKSEWELTCSRQKPTQTLTNMMLSLEAKSNLTIDILLDKYGLRTERATIDYRTWLQYCIDEGCQPYFGLKGKKSEAYSGSVFMVNRLGGYVHLLSIDVPDEALDGKTPAKATARLYCYIPLHNVSDKVLNTNEFEPIN
ncbi:MAG: hypothetical protein ACI4TW_08855 [Prevotella sp.]